MKYTVLGLCGKQVHELDKHYILRRSFPNTTQGVEGELYGAIKRGKKYYTIAKHVGFTSKRYTKRVIKVYKHYTFTRKEVENLIRKNIILLLKGVTL